MAALEEHERFIREFLSQKENTVEDLAWATRLQFQKYQMFFKRKRD